MKGMSHFRQLSKYSRASQDPSKCSRQEITSAELRSPERGTEPKKRPSYAMRIAHGLLAIMIRSTTLRVDLPVNGEHTPVQRAVIVQQVAIVQRAAS